MLATILAQHRLHLLSSHTCERYGRRILKRKDSWELAWHMDNELTNGRKHGLEKTLTALREVAVETNKEWSAIFGIPQSTAITCVKPSGTVSQLVDSSSGIHPRHSSYYIRTVRGDNKDPLTNFMKDSGIPSEADFMKPDTQTVFSFPMKSPKKSVVRNDMTAIEQLEMWLLYQRHWCEHKPSVLCQCEKMDGLGAFVLNTLTRCQVFLSYHTPIILINKHPIRTVQKLYTMILAVSSLILIGISLRIMKKKITLILLKPLPVQVTVVR